MPSQQAPTVRRRLLGMELRRLREAANLTIDEVATALGVSHSKLSRIETAHVSATWRDVRDMLEIYGVSGPRQGQLIQLAREAREKGWWHEEYGDLPGAYAGFEAEASSIWLYEPLIVPGLLQTKRYARAVLEAIRPDLSSEEIEHRVNFRMARQGILHRDSPPTLSVVLDESVLRRPVGGRGVIRQQLNHLNQATTWPNITLQVLRLGVGAHAGMDGGFIVYSFAEPVYSDVVYYEHTAKDQYLENADAIERHKMLFDHLQRKATSPGESRKLIEGAIDEL
jgi:transcriptional regulator with XRE-family HTH domain